MKERTVLVIGGGAGGLCAGIAAYLLMTVLSCKAACTNFEKIDL